MKRWMSLVLVMAMALSMVPAGIAEEFFAEEEFAAEENLESEGFFEEEFFAEESAETEEVEEIDMEEEAAELEDRSIVSLVTDQVDPETSVTTDNYWMAKPILTGGPTTNKKGDVANSVTLTWTWDKSVTVHDAKKNLDVQATKLPKDVKWYVYEVNEDTGVAKQVGKPLGMKGFKQADKTSLYGGTVTIKNVAAGVHKYFVRAEQLTKQKDKSFHEEYGLSSEIIEVTVSDAVSTLWKKLTGIEALQVEKDHITIQVTAEEMLAADQYVVAVKASKPKGFTADSAKIEKKISGDTMLINDTNGYEDGAKVTYTVTPVKNSVNGTKKSISVTVQEALWKCAPDSIDAMVVNPGGNGQPTLRMSFLPMDLEANNLAFNVKGFAKAMFVKKEENGEWAAYDKYDEIGKPAKAQKVPLTKVTEDDGVITVVSVIKKAGGKVTFTVQPQASEAVLKKEVPTGKYKVVKGTASAKYVLATQKDELSGATDIHINSRDKKIEWYCANPNVDYFNVTVAKGEAFSEKTVVASWKEVSETFVPYADKNIEPDKYTVFVETILKSGGRIVTEFSLNFDSKVLAEDQLAPIISKDDYESIYVGEKIVLKADTIASKLVLKVNGKELKDNNDQYIPFDKGAEVDLLKEIENSAIANDKDMKNPYRIQIAGYNEETKTVGEWSEPIIVELYKDLEVKITTDLNTETLLFQNSVTVTAEVTGGSGEYTFTWNVNGKEAENKDADLTIKGNNADADKKLTVFVEVSDPKVEGTKKSDPVVITVDNKLRSKKLIYEINGTEAVLIGTEYTDTEKTNEKSVTKVGDGVEEYTVVKIGDGVFQGFTALTSIELPNTIKNIGANAFNGCTSLATIN